MNLENEDFFFSENSSTKLQSLCCLLHNHLNLCKFNLEIISKCQCIKWCSQDGKFISKYSNSTYNARFVENFKFVVFKNVNGVTMHNISGKLLTELSKVVLTFVAKVKSSPEKRDYDLLLFQGNVDTCKVSQGVLGNFIIKGIMMSALETNFNFNCPIKKGFYYHYNVPNIDTSFVPAFIQPKNREWEMTINAKTKFPKTISLTQLFFVKLCGETTPN